MSLTQIKPLASNNFIQWRAEILRQLQIKDLDEMLIRLPAILDPDDGPNIKAIALLDQTKDKTARAILQMNMTGDVLVQEIGRAHV